MKTTKIVYMLLLGMVVIGMAIVVYQRTVSPTHAVTLDAPGIADQLRSMGELMTVKYVVQKVIAPNGDADGNQPMLLTQGTVSASVQLKNLTSEDIRLDGLRVDIHLPPPMIIETVIDESQTKVWDPEVKLWTARGAADLLGTAVRRDATAWLARQAEQTGILNDATKAAQGAIRRILIASGMERVTFTPVAGQSATPAAK